MAVPPPHRAHHTGVLARVAQRRPVNATLVAVAQFHLDNLGFQHHLALHRDLRGLEKLADLAQFIRHGPHRHDARLRTDNHIASGAAAQHALDGIGELGPEIGA